jgi:cupin 2 domain-containing protein
MQHPPVSPVSIVHLLADLPPSGRDEVFEPIVERPGVRLERIVSSGQSTPPGTWYDQEQDEWVMVVAGAARLCIEGQGVFAMQPGDSVLLPAHCRHRVEWTDPAQPTVWLALHVWPGARARDEEHP